MTKLNTRNAKSHTIVEDNRFRRERGNFDTDKVIERGQRALGVVDNYEIFATGSKRNGWNEVVEGYLVVKPNRKRYEVQIRPSGEGSCNCPDWKTRRHVHAGLCKHVIAVKGIRQGRG